MIVGSLVVRKSYDKDVTFKVIDIKKDKDDNTIYVLMGMSIRIIADSEIEDLEEVDGTFIGEKDKILNKRVSNAINKAISLRGDKEALKVVNSRGGKTHKTSQNKELFFGRPGKILHVDGDSFYLETCMKVYKQLSLNVVGKSIPEIEQPNEILNLVREVKPDIVVLTGHDSVIKETKDYLNLDNYKNSRYFIESVKRLRDYNSNYDDLVIFAGACQSCYEGILDAGANFASSPNRVLIHCLDPVFICEKIAYTPINNITLISEVIESTITGIKGIGGLQTRGKYREGYPKSPYI